jgi:hypothetical protein
VVAPCRLSALPVLFFELVSDLAPNLGNETSLSSLGLTDQNWFSFIDIQAIYLDGETSTKPDSRCIHSRLVVASMAQPCRVSAASVRARGQRRSASSLSVTVSCSLSSVCSRFLLLLVLFAATCLSCLANVYQTVH